MTIIIIGTAPVTVDAMARDTIALIRALGLVQVDLLGFSLGGFVAQTLRDPKACLPACAWRSRSPTATTTS